MIEKIKKLPKQNIIIAVLSVALAASIIFGFISRQKAGDGKEAFNAVFEEEQTKTQTLN